MNSNNPYLAPITESQALETTSSSVSLGRIARATFLAWEKLRIAYVMWLIVVTLLLGSDHLQSFDFWMMSIAGAVFVNLCFFAGPIIETYMTWLGYRGKWLRIALFLLGTAIASGIGVAAIASYQPPQ